MYFVGATAVAVGATTENDPERPVRFATFNTSLYRDKEGGLIQDLAGGDNEQAQRVAEIIQRVRPDVLLLNEFDYDERGKAVSLFRKHYLAVSQNGQPPLRYPHVFYRGVNTGVPTNIDLNGDGSIGGPGDRFGYGEFPGQYGMVVLSTFPFDVRQVRTFQRFRWKDMPNARLPRCPGSGDSFYSNRALRVFRLSSKSHWDLPLRIGDETIHFLVSHPTPPTFDGPEDANGRRNHDEIRLWADYVDTSRSDYIYDDRGRRGGLPKNANFVIAGDLNADPVDGESAANGQQLTKHPLINHSRTPASAGARQASARQGKANLRQKGDPSHDTAQFDAETVGNLRVDYVLPSRNLKIVDAGVFWPTDAEDGFQAIAASDHRLVWIDVQSER
jgi:endonuclease/exonuclease/phosphatase family metal-dependent hydrolase